MSLLQLVLMVVVVVVVVVVAVFEDQIPNLDPVEQGPVVWHQVVKM